MNCGNQDMKIDQNTNYDGQCKIKIDDNAIRVIYWVHLKNNCLYL